MSSELNLLIVREPWTKDFAECCRVAFTRMPNATGPYIRTGASPHGFARSAAIHILVIAGGLIVGPYLTRLAGNLQLVEATRHEQRSIVYVGNRLPEIQDAGSSGAGRSGQSMSATSSLRQSVRVYRDEVRTPSVVDARGLEVKRRAATAANLIVVNPPDTAPARPKIKIGSLTLPDWLISLPSPPAAPIQPKAETAQPKVSVRVNVPRLVLPVGALPAPPPQPIRLKSELEHPRANVKANLPAPSLPDVAVPAPVPEAIAVRAEEPQPTAPASLDVRSSSGSDTLARITPAPALPRTEVQLEKSASKIDTIAELAITGDADGSAVPATVITRHPGSEIALPKGSRGQLDSLPGGTSSRTTGVGLRAANVPGSGPATNGSASGATNSGDGTATAGSGEGGLASGTVTGTDSGSRPSTGITIKNSHSASKAVHLPSFGTNTFEVTAEKNGVAPAMVVIASPTSGGGLGTRLSLKGSRVYTIYISTSVGTAVMQYADPESVHEFARELSAPRPVTTDVPAVNDPVHAIISCVIDQAGMLRNLKLLDGDDTKSSRELLLALSTWRFEPVLRGEQPVAVQTVIGFGIKTK